MNDFIERRIKEREAQIYQMTQSLKSLQQQRREAAAELRAYKDVLSHLKPNVPPDVERQEQAPNTSARVRSRLGDNWRSILGHVRDTYPSALDMAELRSYVQSQNLDVTDDSLRSQLSFYASRGWLERVGQGLYKITEQGAIAVNKPLSPPLGGTQDEEEEEEDEITPPPASNTLSMPG